MGVAFADFWPAAQDIFIVALDFDQTSGHVHTPHQSENVDY